VRSTISAASDAPFGRLLAKLVRFGIVGVLSGAIYAVVTALLISELHAGPVVASVVGYCVSVPASFLGHRRFSFRSQGRWTVEAQRFVLTQALNIAVTAGSMYAATAWLGAHYGWGMFAAVIFVPIANFVVMNLWVFRDQEARQPAATQKKPT
jgi:putative flippase GtrA